MRTLRSALSVIIIATAPAALHAQQPASDGVVLVAVMPMSGFMLGGDGARLSEVFRSMVMTEMAGANARIRMVERQTVDSLLQAQAIAASGSVSDAQAIQIGQLLGAQYMVTGSILVAGGEARLDLRLVDIETSGTPGVFKDQVRVDRLLDLPARVASEFAARAEVKQRVVDVPVPTAAAVAFSRGLDFEKRGRNEDAARMYRRALELFPQHPHAGAALRRVN
ncbi:hypothetical protein BH23GEM10_BH23GEM10_07850 [soil metagenome]